MIKRLRKVGNSTALLLDKAILELLGLEENDSVQLVVDGGSLIVTPTEPQRISQQRLDECLDKIVAERSNVLRRLAQ